MLKHWQIVLLAGDLSLRPWKIFETVIGKTTLVHESNRQTYEAGPNQRGIILCKMNWWKRWKRPTCQHLSPKNSVWRWSCLKLSCLTFYIILQWYKVAHYIVHLFSWFRTWPRSSRSQWLALALDKPLQEESEARSLHSRGYTIPTCTLSMLRIHKNSWFGSSLNGSKSSPATWSDSQSYIVLQSHHWTQVIQDDSRGQQEKEKSRKQSEKKSRLRMHPSTSSPLLLWRPSGWKLSVGGSSRCGDGLTWIQYFDLCVITQFHVSHRINKSTSCNSRHTN